MIGTTDARSSNRENMIGTTDALPTNHANMIGKNENIKALPDYVKSGSWAASTLPDFLRKKEGMLKVKNSGVDNISEILLYLHNNKSGGHRELRHITGLSQGGLAKLIMSMKRRGLITKEKFSRFVLTPGGKELLLRWHNPHIRFSAFHP